MRCSFVCDEFVPWMLKVPLDKKAEPDAQQRALNVISENKKVSVSSPEALMESSLLIHSQYKAVLSQPNKRLVAAALLQYESLRANEVSMESWEFPQASAGETSDDGIRTCSSVLSIETAEADRCSLEHLAEAKEVSKVLHMPAYTGMVRLYWKKPVSKRGANAQMYSPVASVALTPLTLLPAFLSGTLRTSQLNTEFGGLCMKSPYEGNCKWRPPTKATNSSNIPGIESHLLETKTGVLQLVSKPGDIWESAAYFLSGEFEWQARCRPPNAVASNQHCLHNFIIGIIVWSDTWLSPEVTRDSELISKPNCFRVASLSLPNGSSCHRLPVSAYLIASNTTCKDRCLANSWKIVLLNLFTLREINQMECEACLHMLLHSKGLVWRILKLPNRTALRRLVNRIIGKLEFR